MKIDVARVSAIRKEVESQRTRWSEMLRGKVMEACTITVKGPVFRPHVSEEELEELLGLVEENRELRERLGVV